LHLRSLIVDAESAGIRSDAHASPDCSDDCFTGIRTSYPSFSSQDRAMLLRP